MVVIGDDGVEFDDGVAAEEGAGDTAEDRGDNLDDEFLEVDEDVVAALAKDDETNDSRSIPKSRFDEVNNERKELKDRLAALEAKVAAGPVAAVVVAPVVPAAETFDVDAAEDRYAEALTEGDLVAAKEIRKEIRNFEMAALKAELRAENTQSTEMAQVAVRKSAVIAEAFATHPELDSTSAEYDSTLVAKINRMNQSYIQDGMPEDKALQAAIADFVSAPTAAKVTVADTSAVDAKARNARAQAAQPPTLAGTGTGDRARAAAVDIATMTDAELDAMPEREKKRLRGDY